MVKHYWIAFHNSAMLVAIFGASSTTCNGILILDILNINERVR